MERMSIDLAKYGSVRGTTSHGGAFAYVRARSSILVDTRNGGLGGTIDIALDVKRENPDVLVLLRFNDCVIPIHADDDAQTAFVRWENCRDGRDRTGTGDGTGVWQLSAL